MTEKRFGWRRDYFPETLDTPRKDNFDDEPESVPAADQPAIRSDKTQTEVAPAPKS